MLRFRSRSLSGFRISSPREGSIYQQGQVHDALKVVGQRVVAVTRFRLGTKPASSPAFASQVAAVGRRRQKLVQNAVLPDRTAACGSTAPYRQGAHEYK